MFLIKQKFKNEILIKNRLYIYNIFKLKNNVKIFVFINKNEQQT